jgi:hypothetical protein
LTLKHDGPTVLSSTASASVESTHERAKEEALIRAFDRVELHAEAFHHREHVQLTWALLRRMPIEEAIHRLRDGLKRFVASVSKVDRYHETITVFFTTLIHERMTMAAQDETWVAFAERNPDLLASPRALLLRFYSVETLDSDVARRRYLAPDISGAA